MEELIREYVSKDAMLIVFFVENVLILVYLLYRLYRAGKMDSLLVFKLKKKKTN